MRENRVTIGVISGTMNLNVTQLARAMAYLIEGDRCSFAIAKELSRA